MAHPAQHQFVEEIKAKYPHLFENVRVLDVGSLDINGGTRDLFTGEYTGIDVAEGQGVDQVCLGHEFKTDTLFDVVISTECLEHDSFMYMTVNNMKHLVRPGGLLIITAAGFGRPEHGTIRTTPENAPLLSKNEKMNPDHYANVELSDLSCLVNEELFSEFVIKYSGLDIYFYGVKR